MFYKSIKVKKKAARYAFDFHLYALKSKKATGRVAFKV